MRQFARCAVLLVLAAPCGRGPAAWAAEDLVVRAYDIAALAAPVAPEVPGEFGLPRATGAPPFWPTVESEEPSTFCAPDVLVEWIRAGVAPATWESVEGATLQAAGDRLLVTAPEPVQREVAALLGRLWAEAAQRVEVQARWVRVAAPVPPAAGSALERAGHGRLDDAGVAALLEEVGRAGGRASSASTWVRPGRWGRVGEANRVAHVYELDVEIAQASVVGNPIVAQADDGWSVAVRCVPLRDGSVWVEALAQRAELEAPLRSLDTEALALGSIDLPAAHVVRLVTTARVGAGETLVALARSPERPEGLHLLLLRPLVAPPAAPTPGPRRLDLTALVQTPLEFSFSLAGPLWEVGHGQHHAPVLAGPEEGATIPSASEWLERLRQEEGPEAWGADGAGLSQNEGALYVLGPAALADRADRWLAGQEAEALRSVRLSCTLSEAEEAGAWRAVGGFALDVPLGRRACAEAGVERRYLADWDVEVAQEARVGDPIVGTVFGGLWANLRVEATPTEHEFAVLLEGGVYDLGPTFDLRRSRNEITGVLESPRMARAPVGADLVLAAGKPVVLEGVGDAARRRRLEIRLGP